MDTIDQLIAEAENRLKSLESERAEILAKLEELRRKKETVSQADESSASYLIAAITKDSSPAEKIALFCSLFKGREDVYALGWESRKSGKSGFQPACRCSQVKILCLRVD